MAIVVIMTIGIIALLVLTAIAVVKAANCSVSALSLQFFVALPKRLRGAHRVVSPEGVVLVVGDTHCLVDLPCQRPGEHPEAALHDGTLRVDADEFGRKFRRDPFHKTKLPWRDPIFSTALTTRRMHTGSPATLATPKGTPSDSLATRHTHGISGSRSRSLATNSALVSVGFRLDPEGNSEPTTLYSFAACKVQSPLVAP